LAFSSRVASVNPVAIPFDPVAMRAGEPVVLDTQNNIRVPSGMSPDGKQLAYYSIGEQQEDLFVGPVGGPMRRLTDDPGRDRMPEFAPDGRSLVFYSNRDGRWAIWRIGVDGGGLRKVAGPATGTVYVNLSPQGDRVAFSDDQNNGVYTTPVESAPDAAPTKLPGTLLGAGQAFGATAWSRDGLRLAGLVSTPGGRPAGVAMYDFGARTTTMLSPDQAFHVEWLADSRRIVYFVKNELVVLDTVTRSRTTVPVRLPAPVGEEAIVISPDNRTIYYGAIRSESDIWIVERK
jgi:dipeptidyl aminopeptidase/acylaminoacyl peptidase